VSSIEARCNAEIQQARAVRVRVYDAADAGEVAASPLFRGTLPPADKIQVRIDHVIESFFPDASYWIRISRSQLHDHEHIICRMG
jgi:hypothetical protein